MISTPKLYMALIVLVGFVGGYIIYTQWIKPGETLVAPAPISSQDNLTVFQNLKIDFSILDSADFKGLIISGESPVNPGITGKRDIFAPTQ